ncbi:hypothetical protein PRZ48_014019 [Zasmidium cellare]|uniref:Heterokaryon incompatibility domain-containing protein n=1 Tax=Zasmidium cellare TaxID=395010 RepID=A0ABR0E0A7_ZASCE|nr:hypothetical protein PRZ48_014019 [Zasmidium cellare]
MALHRPLKSANSIRLLNVWRNENKQVVGKLESFVLGLRRTPPYKAISYVWGDRTEQRTIVVNGGTISVLASVHVILEALCDSHELFFGEQDPATPTWVWLDSICINQRDVDEVGQQIAFMANIFGEARSVIIWLGPGTSQTDRGMELIQALADREENNAVSQPIVSDIEAWQGYKEIGLNPWWKRAWTLQESLVPRDVVYHCGTKYLSEEQYMRATLLTAGDLIPEVVSKDEQPWAAMWNRRRITQWFLKDEADVWEGRRPGHSIKLLALLAYTRHTLASDDQDYIYSLVGCVNDTDRSVVGHPNYALDVGSTYTRFCRDWITGHRSLDILCFTTLFRPLRDGTKATLPSWAPDWRERASEGWSVSNPVPLLASQPANRHTGSFVPQRFLLGPADNLPYTASGDRRPHFHFSDDMRQLTCKGLVLDRLDGIAGMVDSSASGSTRVYANRVLAQMKAFIEDVDPNRKGKGRRRSRELLAWLRYNSALVIRGVPLGDAFDPKNLQDLPTLSGSDITNDDGSEHDIEWNFKKAATIRDMARRLGVTENGHGFMEDQAVLDGQYHTEEFVLV